MPSGSVAEERSIIRGTSSIAAKPAVSTFSSLFEISLFLDKALLDALCLSAEGNFFCLST